MKERIAITGSNGTIGRALTKGLEGAYQVTPLDLPETDLRHYGHVVSRIRGHKAVVHLAWNTVTDNYLSGEVDPGNMTMYHNVYKGALEVGIPRVIMASSVHADTMNYQSSEIMSPYATPVPDSPYGASKVGMEAMGRYFARRGLEVVCIRFAGMDADGRPSEDPEKRSRWFSNRDAVSLVDTILRADTVPDNFAIVYGMSNNPGRIHDLSNPFGWQPNDSA